MVDLGLPLSFFSNMSLSLLLSLMFFSVSVQGALVLQAPVSLSPFTSEHFPVLPVSFRGLEVVLSWRCPQSVQGSRQEQGERPCPHLHPVELPWSGCCLPLHILMHSAVLPGGRDKRGGPILTFPARSNHDRIRQEDLRRLISYLACIPRYALWGTR